MPPFDPDAIQHPRRRRFFEYWRSKQRNNAFPGRADIDPLEFPWALGYVSLYDVLADGEFRCRLDATNAAMFFDNDLTGTWLSAHCNLAIGAMMVATFTHVVGIRAPLLASRDLLVQNRVWRYQSLVLPFAADGEKVDMVASVLSYDGGGD